MKNSLITKSDIDKSPWLYSPRQYQYAHKVHEPWIAEISPFQFAGLSKRAKLEYERKRSTEWGASAAIKQEWRDKVIASYNKGLITESTPGLSNEAKDIIFFHKREEREYREKKAKDIKEASRIIRSPSELKVGDIIDTTLYGKGLKVVRVSRKSATAEGKFGRVKVQFLGNGPVTARWPESNPLIEGLITGLGFGTGIVMAGAATKKLLNQKKNPTQIRSRGKILSIKEVEDFLSIPLEELPVIRKVPKSVIKDLERTKIPYSKRAEIYKKYGIIV